MSRSGYSDDLDNWALIKWRGQVASATRGARGQALLRELLAALDAMPEKRLAAGSFSTPRGEFCTLGVLGAARGLDMTKFNEDAEAEDGVDRRAVAEAFGVASPLVAEIMFENDEAGYLVWPKESPQARWLRMRTWVASQIAPVGDEHGRELRPERRKVTE